MSSGLRRCIGLRRWCGMAVSDFFTAARTLFFLSFPKGICVFCCLFLLHINRKTVLILRGVYERA